MSIWGFVFLTAVTVMLAEMLIHIVIFAKTGKGGFEDRPFEFYGEFVRRSTPKTKDKCDISESADYERAYYSA